MIRVGHKKEPKNALFVFVTERIMVPLKKKVTREFVVSKHCFNFTDLELLIFYIVYNSSYILKDTENAW